MCARVHPSIDHTKRPPMLSDFGLNFVSVLSFKCAWENNRLFFLSPTDPGGSNDSVCRLRTRCYTVYWHTAAYCCARIVQLSWQSDGKNGVCKGRVAHTLVDVVAGGGTTSQTGSSIGKTWRDPCRASLARLVPPGLFASCRERETSTADCVLEIRSD